jgi:NADPH-dependent curcumin reductase
MSHQRLTLVRRPTGLPANEDFALETVADAAPSDGEVAIEITHLSIDPAMRVWMSEARSYWPPVGLGEVMRAQAIGTITASNADGFRKGDVVSGMLGAQNRFVGSTNGLQKLDVSRVPATWYLHALGATGMTAYFGLHDIGKLKAGDTLVVSAAAGAVGSIVCQLGREHGARVIGIAGGPDKCAFVKNDLKCDGVIDYRAGPIGPALSELAPKGVDVYFDNVGGEVLDAVLARLKRHARIVLCGGISQYNATGRALGPANYLSLIAARASMQGFVVIDYFERYKEFAVAIGGMIAAGKIIAREDIVDGLGNFPAALRRLYQSQNFGKQLVKV